MAAPVRIMLGAGLDSSVEQTFASFEKRAERAAKTAERTRTRVPRDDSAQAAKTAAKEQEQAAKKAARVREQEAKRAAKEEEKAAKQSAKVKEKIAKTSAQKELAEIRRIARERAREHKQLLDEVAREERKAAKERERVAKKEARAKEKAAREAQRNIDRFATRTSHRATRFFWPNMPITSMARRGANDIVRGLGIDTSISGGVTRAKDLQEAAYFLSSKGYRMGESGSAGKRVDPNTLISEARTVADEQMMDPQKVIESQKAFVGLTGDLATARAMMSGMAALSGATGSELEDLGQAAGAMGNALDDELTEGKEKATALLAVMRMLAGQGKLTAIEMDTLAPNMPKLVSAARMFGGDTGQRIAELGALSQLSVGKGGGAWNAASASTAAAGFAADLQSQKAEKNFRRVGIKLKDEQGMLRGPFELIREALEKTGGDSTKMGRLFQSQRGGRMVNSLSAMYRRAGGGDAGMSKVNAELKRLMKGANLSPEQIAEINEKRKQTAAAKAQHFQNQIDKIVESSATKLIPALERLAPTALSAAEALGDIVQWATEKPGQAIGVAIAASIARAGIESTFRTAIDTALKQAIGGETSSAFAALSGKNGALGAFGSALAVATAGLSAFHATMAFLDWEESRRQKGENSAIMTDVQTGNEIGSMFKGRFVEGNLLRSAKENGVDQELYKKLTLNRDRLASRIKDVEGYAWYKPYETFTQEGRNRYEQIQSDKQRIDELKVQMARVEAVLAGGINVTVANAADMRPQAPGPTVDPSGREP